MRTTLRARSVDSAEKSIGKVILTEGSDLAVAAGHKLYLISTTD